MNPVIVARMTAIFISLSLILMLLALAPITSAEVEVTELNVSPQVIMQGETLSISGKASPDDLVWLTTSFEMSLPVTGGNYSVEFDDINFPVDEKEFLIHVENIKNAKIGIDPVEVKMGEWLITGPLTAICDGENIRIILGELEVLNELLKITDGSLTFFHSFPMTIENYPKEGDSTTIYSKGKKDIRISGEAADGAPSVNVEQSIGIKTSVVNGNFALGVDTSGIPPGAFLIEAGDGGMSREMFITSSLPILSLSADESDITVGDTVIITAQLKNQEGNILQEGIFIDFDTTTGQGTLSDSRVMTDASGKASTRLTSATAGTATVCAYCDDITSNDVSVVFSVLATPTPTPSPTPTSNPSSNGGNGAPDTTLSPTPSPSPSPLPSSSPSPSPTSTATPATTAASTPITPTATATSIPSPIPSPSPSASPSQRWIPGFEAVFAIAGLLAVVYLVRRKRE